MARKSLFFALVIAAVAGGGYWVYSTRTTPVAAQTQPAAGQPAGARPVPVVVSKVARGAQPVDITAIGAVQASETVAIKSRLDGLIVKVHFKEGDEVKTGDPLFTLDQRALEAQLKQAEAQLARDRSQLQNYRRESQRVSALVSNDFVSRTRYDDVQTQASNQDATVKASEAAVENLKVSLSYAVIRSPIDGKTGVINLTVGNNVKANDTITMVSINKIHPVNVLFAVPQKYFGMVQQVVNGGGEGVKVIADVPYGVQSAGARSEGTLKFIDNAIDTATGTFQVKASFPNPEAMLWPGMFVNVVLRMGTEPNALSVPSAAVQNGQQGQFVYVIKQDSTAEVRPVKVARDVEGGQTVLQDGVKEGETVVIDGQLRLTAGVRVDARQPTQTAQSPTPASATK